MKKNKNGLPREIHPNIKKKIRKNSYFSCVVCGNAFYQYEHVDPTFEEATIHDPNCITLLCGACHDNVTRGVWSKEKIKMHMRKPYSKQEGHALGEFDFYNNLELEIGDTKFLNCQNVLVIDNIVLIKIIPNNSGEPYPPFLLTAKFYDSDKKIIFDIINNEFKINSEAWDVVFHRKDKKTFIEIKSSEDLVALRLILNPPNGIKVDHLDMHFGSTSIMVLNNTLSLKSNLNLATMTFYNCTVKNCKNAITISDQKITIG